MTQEQKVKFGEALANARKAAGLAQIACARRCGVSIVSYQNWERGMCEPRAAKMDLICEFLGLNAEDFK